MNACKDSDLESQQILEALEENEQQVPLYLERMLILRWVFTPSNISTCLAISAANMLVSSTFILQEFTAHRRLGRVLQTVHADYFLLSLATIEIGATMPFFLILLRISHQAILLGHSVDLLRVASVSVVSGDLLSAAIAYHWQGIKMMLFGFTFVPPAGVAHVGHLGGSAAGFALGALRNWSAKRHEHEEETPLESPDAR